MTYVTNSMAWIGKDGGREIADFDTLTAARKHCIKEIAKKRMWGKVQNNWYEIRSGKYNEGIQAINDGRANYICMKAGKGGNKSYLRILNSKGEPVSPKMSVYAFEVGWMNGLKWYYRY